MIAGVLVYVQQNTSRHQTFLAISWFVFHIPNREMFCCSAQKIKFLFKESTCSRFVSNSQIYTYTFMYVCIMYAFYMWICVNMYPYDLGTKLDKHSSLSHALQVSKIPLRCFSINFTPDLSLTTFYLFLHLPMISQQLKPGCLILKDMERSDKMKVGQNLGAGCSSGKMS